MAFKQHIPNSLTLGNLICGSISVVNIAEGGDPMLSGWLIFLAAFFDLLDGAIARALHVSGELGKQLDSLADVISFGLAPSVFIYHMMSRTLSPDMEPLKYLAFINVAAAAIRLARFNISTDQKHDFSGMPSPANGIFWASVLLTMEWYPSHLLQQFLTNPTIDFAAKNFMDPSLLLKILVVLTVLVSWLMIAPMRMFSFKLRPGGFAANKIPFLFIGILPVAGILTYLQFHSIIPAIPICLSLYILMSVIYHFSVKAS